MLTGIDHVWLFVMAGLLLNLTPGPDVVYIAGQAMRQGVRAGLVAALGITAGCLVHVLAAGLGVSALVAASAGAFTVLKLLGAAYLVWLGLRMFFSRDTALAGAGAAGAAGAVPALRRVFWGGFMTNALNPKVALFFLAFLPQFIRPDTASPVLAFLMLGLLFCLNSLWVNGGYAVLAAWAAARMATMRRGLHALERALGVLLAGFGLKLALAELPAS